MKCGSRTSLYNDWPSEKDVRVRRKKLDIMLVVLASNKVELFQRYFIYLKLKRDKRHKQKTHKPRSCHSGS